MPTSTPTTTFIDTQQVKEIHMSTDPFLIVTDNPTKYPDMSSEVCSILES